MIQKKSAGILLYRLKNKVPEVLIVHPGGPFWEKKDEGSWGIPKGEFEEPEKPFDAALREFEEETGVRLNGSFIELHPVKLKSGKLIFAWSVEGDFQTKTLKCNTFKLEWPPGSGNKKEFPEIDKAEWFGISEAKLKINNAQVSFLEQLEVILNLRNA